MSDEFLKALGRAGRRERDGADALEAPVLDEAVKERMVVAALDALRQGKGSGAEPPLERAAPLLREGTGGRRRRPFLVRGGVAAAVLLAASLALFVGLRNDPLPAYSASVRGGTQEWRGEPAPGAPEVPLVVRGDGEVEIVLRPADPVKRPLQARAFAVKGEVVRTLPVEVSAQGTARVVGRADVLLGAAPEGIGAWRVTLFVGDSVPETLREAQGRDGLRRVVVPVTVVTAPSAP